jgi:type I restriction enzyme R subunit
MRRSRVALSAEMPDPEQLARQEIDALLTPCGWVVQDKRSVNLSAARGVAVRELTFKTGEPDYTLFIRRLCRAVDISTVPQNGG